MMMSYAGEGYALALVRAAMLAVVVWLYIASGIASWRKLLAYSDACGVIELLVLSKYTLGGKVGKWITIFSWPAWDTLPRTMVLTARWFRNWRGATQTDEKSRTYRPAVCSHFATGCKACERESPQFVECWPAQKAPINMGHNIG